MPKPIPTPSSSSPKGKNKLKQPILNPTNPPAPLDNISSSSYLTIWDTYVNSILQGIHTFHGADSSSSHDTTSQYVAGLADTMMEQRQERAQGHIDQKIVEKQQENEDKSKK